MSEWAWTKCKQCGERVHINTKCKCGGDPWGLAELSRKDIDLLLAEKKKLNKRLSEINAEIKLLSKKL